MILRKQRAWIRGWINVTTLYVKRADQRQPIRADIRAGILRKLLKLPIVWAWAVKKAEAESHTRASDCLACLGKLRREKYKHVPFLSISGSLICKRCSLPVWYWKQQPKCKLKKPPVQGTPIKRPDYIIVPVD